MPMYKDASEATKLFAINLRYAAKKRGVTQLDIAAGLDTVKQSVNGWFQAYRMPNPTYMDKLAEFLQLPVSAFFDENGHCGSDTPRQVSVPFVSEDGTVSLAGNFDSTLIVPKAMTDSVNSTSTFIFSVPDELMSPKFHKDDLLLCRHASTAPSGSFVIAIINGKTAVRQYNYSHDGSIVFFMTISQSSSMETDAWNAKAKDKPTIIGIPFYLQRKV